MSDHRPRIQVLHGFPELTTSVAGSAADMLRPRGVRMIIRLDDHNADTDELFESFVNNGLVNHSVDLDQIPPYLSEVITSKWSGAISDSDCIFETEKVTDLDLFSSGRVYEVQYPGSPLLRELPTLFAWIAATTDCPFIRSDAVHGWLLARFSLDKDAFGQLAEDQRDQVKLDLGGYVARLKARSYEQTIRRGEAHAAASAKGAAKANTKRAAAKAQRDADYRIPERMAEVLRLHPSWSLTRASDEVARHLEREGKEPLSAKTIREIYKASLAAA